jgi:hypothetical protein
MVAKTYWYAENPVLPGYSTLVGELQKAGFSMTPADTTVIHPAKRHIGLMKMDTAVIDGAATSPRAFMYSACVAFVVAENVNSQRARTGIHKSQCLIECL